MKDIAGRDLAIGQLIACGSGGSLHLVKGVVRKVTPKSVVLDNIPGDPRSCFSGCVRPHEEVVIIEGF